MTKEEAIELYGEDIIERVRDMFETDFHKIVFVEDALYNEDYILSENKDEFLRYVYRAQIFLGKK